MNWTTEPFTKASGLEKASDTAEESKSGPMAVNTKATGDPTWPTVVED